MMKKFLAKTRRMIKASMAVLIMLFQLTWDVICHGEIAQTVIRQQVTHANYPWDIISECHGKESLKKYDVLVSNESYFDSLLQESNCLPMSCTKLSWEFHEKRYIADLTTERWQNVFKKGEGWDKNTCLLFSLQSAQKEANLKLKYAFTNYTQVSLLTVKNQ